MEGIKILAEEEWRDTEVVKVDGPRVEDGPEWATKEELKEKA